MHPAPKLRAMSRLRTWPISCANTARNSCGVRRSSSPVVTATTEAFVPAAKALGSSEGMIYTFGASPPRPLRACTAPPIPRLQRCVEEGVRAGRDEGGAVHGRRDGRERRGEARVRERIRRALGPLVRGFWRVAEAAGRPRHDQHVAVVEVDLHFVLAFAHGADAARVHMAVLPRRHDADAD